MILLCLVKKLWDYFGGYRKNVYLCSRNKSPRYAYHQNCWRVIFLIIAALFCYFQIIMYFCKQNKDGHMLELQDCIIMLSDFKSTFAQKFGIIKLGIFGSVARNENTENSETLLLKSKNLLYN